MFARDVSAHCVVSSECSRAKWTRHAYTLMPLSDMSSQIRFVSVQTFAKRTLQFFSCEQNHMKVNAPENCQQRA